jgi:hypothetical protein
VTTISDCDGRMSVAAYQWWVSMKVLLAVIALVSLVAGAVYFGLYEALRNPSPAIIQHIWTRVL